MIPRSATRTRRIVGFSGTFVYSDGRWDGDANEDRYLAIDIQDSDIATVDYRAAGDGGRFYLGFQPSEYFEDPDASEPIDVGEEASRFAAWSQHHLGATATAADLRQLLAEVGDEPEEDFAEETVARLLGLLGLPIPDGLPAPK